MATTSIVSSSSKDVVVGDNNDEALKKNTDCVYFLASPLTCKKGSECEYRHSEYARVNPRDCWYWLNGNCLNPKCSFRHPPLEGLVGPQTGNFAGPPSVVPPAQPVPTAPPNPTKQGVPCIFFQKGYCLKGDRCPFVHGPNSASIKVQPQVQTSTTTPEAPPFKKTFGTLEKSTQPKGNFNVNTPKVVEPPAQAKVAPKVQSNRSTNGQPVGRVYHPSNVVVEEAPSHKQIKRSSVASGRTHHGGSFDDFNSQNGRDVDDSLRESSPGFDVLVDDKLSDDEYYHNDDRYARMRGVEEKNVNEFDLDHPGNYSSLADVEYNRCGYDSFDRIPEKYGRDHHRLSSERSLVEPTNFNRRGSYNKSQSPDLNHNSDLRQRLASKQRRGNGLKSVVNDDYNVNSHADDRGYRNSQRDPRRSPIRETSRGNRLQGRIKLPRRSSPIGGSDVYSERENDRGRNWGRSSPTRQQISGQQSRLQDRLSRRNLEEPREGRRINGPMMRTDTFPANDSNFAGPKSLSELKGTKPIDNNRQPQVKIQQPVLGGKLRDTVLAGSMGTDGGLSFEGPKPLSEILKRKRTGPTSDTNTENKEMKQHENEIVNKDVAFEANEEEGEVSNKKSKLMGEDESPLPNDEDGNKDDNKVGEVEVEINNEEQEFDEGYDQGDGEYEYEQEEGERYDLNEVDNGEQDVDSMDEDDGDDFAKTLGVSF